MKLFYTSLSGHAHRAKLFRTLAGVDHELVRVNVTASEYQTPAFPAINPFGQVPVLVDGATVVTDSNAILVCLGTKHQKTDGLPQPPADAAAVQRWLSVAARLITLVNAPFYAQEVVARANVTLALTDAELDDREWLAAPHPTIADVALYNYIANAPEVTSISQGYRTSTHGWHASRHCCVSSRSFTAR